MARILTLSLKCPHCGTRQPSGIAFSDTHTLDGTSMSGNLMGCVKCGQFIACNRENMAYVLEGDQGGGVGPDYGR